MASGIYNIFKANMMKKVVHLETDTIRTALYNSSHSFTATNTDYTTTNELATAGGYTQGGQDLTTKAVTVGATTKWDSDDVSWTSASFTANHTVIYDNTVGATNNLIASIDFGGNQTVTSGTFTIQWHANGIITLT